MKDIEIIVILLIIFYFLMRKSKKEHFGHNIWNCKGNNDCMMFHQEKCSDSEMNAGNCTHKQEHDKYLNNETNPNFQYTSKNISNSIMFGNQQATSNQQTDNTSSQETINLKQHENTTLSELCTKLGM